MSNEYKTQKIITLPELVSDRLKKYGISARLDADSPNNTHGYLNDGINSVWVLPAGRGVMLTRYGSNDPNHILNSISQEFETEIYDEEEPQFWGYDTEEEMIAGMARFARNDEAGPQHGLDGSLDERIAKLLRV
jgi:hypothetical protein